MNKALLHFVARSSRKNALFDSLLTLADTLASCTGHRATVLSAHSDDPMRGSGDRQKLPFAFDASLELLANGDINVDHLHAVMSEHLQTLKEDVHFDLSAAMLGDNKVFVKSQPTPIRFQYCMRRRADFSNARYRQYYEQEHAKFGIGMHGIEGYVQFHADMDAGQSLAQVCGFGVHALDSVSELHVADMDTFYAGMSKGIDAGNPGEDEDRFVDRRRSVMWVSDEVYRTCSKLASQSNVCQLIAG
ncbi:MAG: EthD domain-containing protein [Pseudomonadota bacterium]